MGGKLESNEVGVAFAGNYTKQNKAVRIGHLNGEHKSA